MSDHKNIYAALAAAQANMGTVVKGAVNPAFKSTYADLADVVSVVIPALSAQGIAMYHTMIRDEFGTAMRTTFSHGATDTHIHCDVPLIVAQNNMQGMKSATTYAKRIGVESLSGIAPDDDDGNAAAKAAPKSTEVEALGDAWRDGVLDSLPADATPIQKAKAFADAICADFAAVKGAKALSNRWDRHAKMIKGFEDRYPDLHTQVVDAFENRMIEITPREAAE